MNNTTLRELLNRVDDIKSEHPLEYEAILDKHLIISDKTLALIGTGYIGLYAVAGTPYELAVCKNDT